MAPGVSGKVRFDPQDLEHAEVLLSFDAAALKVSIEGEPPKDVPEVQRVMMSEKVLDVAKHPRIEFRSQSVGVVNRRGDTTTLRLSGELTLRGVTRPIQVLADVTLAPDHLTARSEVSIKQTAFGIQPVTAGLGTVKVKDEVETEFEIFLKLAESPPAHFDV